jgi:uncharacterized membrane protein YccC
MPSLAAPLAEAGRAAIRIDRSKIAVDVGLRVSLGVGLCLVVGRLSGHTVAGVTATIGALSAGMASHQGTYRSRAGIVIAAAAAMGACAALGAAVGHIVVADIIVTVAVSFAAAMLVSLGPGGSVVGIQAVVGLVVFSQFRLPWSVALRDGGLVLLGGAVQALLVVLVWPLRRFASERRALGAAYGALSGYCRDAAAGRGGVFDQTAFAALDAVWRDAQPFGGDEIASYRALAAQADRLRMELVALVRARTRLAANGEERVAAPVDEVLSTAAAILGEVATAVRQARVPAGWEPERIRFRTAREQLRRAADESKGTWESAAALDAENRVDALAGQIRAVLRTAAVPAGAEPAERDMVVDGNPAAGQKRPGGAKWVSERGATLRSNLTFSSQSFRHAVRMAVAMGVAVAVSHAFPYQHHYWLPMTTLLVLRPDFTSTVARGLSRVAGTLFGAGLVTFVLAELRPTADWLIVLVILLCFPAAALVLANYAVFSVCIASLVVTLLAFTGAPEVATAGDRSVYTLAGAAVAFIAYFAWPTWEATTLPDTLAGLLGTEGRYARLVLEAWSDPPAADRPALQKARLDARLARTNAEAALSRWLAEPEAKVGLRRRETVLGFMASIRSCVQALLALHAELPTGGPGYPQASVLAAGVDQAFALLSDSVKGAPPAAAFPLLRKEQLALTAALPVAGEPSTAPGGLVVLAGETDLLVDSIDAMGHLMGLGGVTEGT